MRLLARKERIDYETAWKRVVGRDLLLDPGLDGVVADPKLAPRPPLSVTSPTLSIFRSEDRLGFIAPGFHPGERASRSVRRPDGHVATDEVQADGRGVIAWAWKLHAGTRYVANDVELRGASGACAGRYHDRAP